MTLAAGGLVLLALTPGSPLAAQQPLAGFCLFARGTAVGQSRAGAAAKARLDRIEAGIAQTAAGERQALVNEDTALLAQRAQLGPAEFARRIEQLRARLAQQEATTQRLAQQLARARANAEARIDAALQPVLGQVRADRQCLVIMERNNAYVYANSVDITGDVVRRLDQVQPPFDVGLTPP